MDTISPEQRSRVMACVGQKHTAPEMAVRRLLHSLGYRYRLHAKNLPGSPDLVFASRRKVIMVHGCFWHRHGCRYFRMPKSRLDFWDAKLTRNHKRDALIRRALKRIGWQVLTVWECDLRLPDRLTNRIVRFLEGT